MYLTSMKVMLRKVSMSLLVGLMVFTSLSLVAPRSTEAAPATTNLSITGTVVSEEATVVTVTADVYATQAGSLDDLKAAITLSRSGYSDYSALGQNDTVELTNTPTSATLVLRLHGALTNKTNAIRIAEGALVDTNGINFDQVNINNIIGLDRPPVYIGSTSENNGGRVYLIFDENFTITSMGSSDNLRNKLSISTDGVNFAPLFIDSSVGTYDYNKIKIEYNNDMKVISSRNTVIKIAAGTLQDDSGNVNEEMIVDIAPPFIQSAEISSNNQDVTITFHEDVFDNTWDGTESELYEYIYLLRDGENSDWLDMTEGDTASIVAGKLVIHYAQALTGSNNLIIIDDYALKDISGNVLSEDVSTPYIVANEGVETPELVDTKAPRQIDIFFSNSNQDITIVFDEDIQNNKASEADFMNSILFPYDQYNQPHYYDIYKFPLNATVSFSGPILNIHFDSPMSNAKYFRIPADSIKDLAGNVLSNNIEAYISTNDNPLHTYDIRFSKNGSKLSLYYSAEIKDNTEDLDGLSQLYDKIKISTDGGEHFSPLGAEDTILINGSKLTVFFNETIKNGNIQLQVEAGVLSAKYGYWLNKAIDATVAYNTPDLTGYFFSNTESEFTFVENEQWRSKVSEIFIYEGNTETLRPMNTSDYTLTAGLLTIKSGVFRADEDYELVIIAEGYSSKFVEGYAKKSNEIFYMTAPVITTTNGITATMNVLNTQEWYNAGQQIVVFQLMNGTTPVSITTSNMRLNSGSYSVRFNVTDAATNPDYSVKVFIVSRFDLDSTSIGTSLVTEVSQRQLDLMSPDEEYEY